jgi:cytochrome c-type biogenesis protein
VNLLIAFLAGIIGFVSPCSFAVFPAFLAFLFKERKRAVFLTIAFMLGIMTSFVLMGVAAGLVGVFFSQLKRELAWISGTLLIAFGIMLLLNKGFGFLTFRMDHPKKTHTFLSMALLGFFFALGWTPCVGPILSGVLVLAANSGTVFTSALMLFAYACGVAVPLLAVAFLSDTFDIARYLQGRHLSFKLFGKQVHTHVYNIFGGLLLIGLGAVILFYRGTQDIEAFFVDHTPWGMEKLFLLNDAVLAWAPLQSTAAKIIGGLVLLGVVALCAWAVRRRAAGTKFK